MARGAAAGFIAVLVGALAVVSSADVSSTCTKEDLQVGVGCLSVCDYPRSRFWSSFKPNRKADKDAVVPLFEREF